MKRCSILLIIREMQIKTVMVYHLIRTPQWSLLKSPQAINAGDSIEKGYPLHCWWECKLATMENSTEVS